MAIGRAGGGTKAARDRLERERRERERLEQLRRERERQRLEQLRLDRLRRERLQAERARIEAQLAAERRRAAQGRVLISRIVAERRVVRGIKRELDPITWQRFDTAGDERVCPVCGPLNGREWSERQPAGQPRPPLHVNCRCRVRYSRTTYAVRLVPTVSIQTTYRKEWEWKRTGWR